MDVRAIRRSHWWTERWLRLWVSPSLPICLALHLPIHLSIFLPVYLPIYLYRYTVYIYISIYLSIWSTYLSIYLDAHSSKTKYFCESSFTNGKLSAELSAANAFCDFSHPISKENQHPDLRTWMSLVPSNMYLCRSSSSVPSFWQLLQDLQVLLSFGQVHDSIALATKNNSSTSKSGAKVVFFFFKLSSKCASPYYGVHFLNISTSKIAPKCS